MYYSEEEVLLGSEGTDENIILVDETAHVAKIAINRPAVDTNIPVYHHPT